jgi:pilus assembly protein Flp/PilA
MPRLLKWFVDFVRREEGPTAVEYAIMLVLVIVVCVASVAVLGSNSSNTFKNVGTRVAS